MTVKISSIGRHQAVVTAALILALAGCRPAETDSQQEQKEKSDIDKQLGYGVEYVYDREVLPEIHAEVPLDEWNALLKAYDNNKDTKLQVRCNVKFVRRGEVSEVKDVGIRIRGNGSRRRPEGKSGVMHTAGKTDWNRFHMSFHFRKFVKDDEHYLHGAHKILLKYGCTDRSLTREVYAYDLFRRAGIWSVSNAVHCRLWIKVVGDPKETYYGIYTLYEPVDEEFLKYRKQLFGSAKGNLWKCRQPSRLDSIKGDFGPDEDGDVEHTYELKTNLDQYGLALYQFQDFITKLNSLNGQEFHDWIGRVCDVSLLLRTYAVNVALGQWDDYWVNGNNFYVYFNSTDYKEYKFFFIPTDYDNSLGTSKVKGKLTDAGSHNPLEWGQDSSPLIKKILEFDDYRKIYTDALLELIDKDNELLYYESSIARIESWYQKIKPYVSNDTGEDMTLKDLPASWSVTPDYRLLDDGENVNFFRAKEKSILKYCAE